MKTAGALALCGALASCAPPGQGALRGVDQPRSGEYVQIVSVSPSLVEIESSGRIVKAAAPAGGCIPTDSIQTLGRAAFLLIDDCAGGETAGVLSVSVSTKPLALPPERLARLLRTKQGMAALGFQTRSDAVSLVEAVVEGDAVIAVIEDRSGFGPAFAGDLMVRAFTELNGRMTVVTLTSLIDAPRDAKALREDLGRFVAALREANV